METKLLDGQLLAAGRGFSSASYKRSENELHEKKEERLGLLLSANREHYASGKTTRREVEGSRNLLSSDLRVNKIFSRTRLKQNFPELLYVS